MNLSFLQLRYFLELTKTLNFTTAAQNLYISQQSLSVLISNLEEKYGVKLFERTRPLSLTKAGACLKAKAETLIFLEEQMEKELKDLSPGKTPSLTIGISFAYAHLVLPGILAPYLIEHPEVKVSIKENTSINCLEDQLSKNEIEIGIGHTPANNPEIQTVLLRDDPFCVFAPYPSLVNQLGSRKAEEVKEKLKKKADVRILEGCTFIMPGQGRSRIQADEIIREHKAFPKSIIETGSMETAIGLCNSGVGISIAPKILLGGSPNTRFPIEDIYPISGHNYAVYLSYLSNGYITTTMKSFIKFTLEKNKI